MLPRPPSTTTLNARTLNVEKPFGAKPLVVDNSAPEAAARAAPMPKVSAYVLAMSMPISRAATRSWPTARIEEPVRVWSRNRYSRYVSSRATTTAPICVYGTYSGPMVNEALAYSGFVWRVSAENRRSARLTSRL